MSARHGTVAANVTDQNLSTWDEFRRTAQLLGMSHTSALTHAAEVWLSLHEVVTRTTPPPPLSPVVRHGHPDPFWTPPVPASEPPPAPEPVAPPKENPFR